MTANKQQQIINRVLTHPVNSLYYVDNEVYLSNPYIAFRFKEKLNDYQEAFKFDVKQIIEFYKNDNQIPTPTLKEVREFYKQTPNKPYVINGVKLSPYWLKTILEIMQPKIFYKGNAIYATDGYNEAILLIVK